MPHLDLRHVKSGTAPFKVSSDARTAGTGLADRANHSFLGAGIADRLDFDGFGKAEGQASRLI